MPPQGLQNRNRIKNVLGILLTPLVLYLLLRLFEYVQVYQPRTELVHAPTDVHPSPEEFYLPSGDAYRIHGWFFSAVEDGPWSDWVVLISHGNGGNISYRLGLYEIWLREGFSVMVYDYRGYGRSSGRPSEEGTYQDAVAAYQWLRQEKRFPTDKIIAMGESLGGAVATELAVRQPIAALVLQSTFTRIIDIGKELFPFLPVETLSTINYDTRSKLPSVKIPKLILHSREDGMIPFHHAEKNHAACPEPKLFGEITGGHNDPLHATAEAYHRHIARLKDLIRDL